ncbi:MAG TPA: nucleotidyltransferase domain-containing protein [Stellaceae bacterium]|nr:nucleotidyltransferase domain-containing protein [Stellaceae bacterium]
MTYEAPGYRDAAAAFAGRMAAAWGEMLGARLLGVYLIGSLAHGGFSARYSDIDVGVTTEDGVRPDELEAMRARAAADSRELAAKLSIFWSDRSFAMGRFPPLDRVDYVDHAVPLVERERIRPPRPTRDEIRTYLRGQPFEAWTEQVRRFSAASALQPAEHKPYVRCLLYPARLLYSFATGAMASNDEAAAFLAWRRIPGLDFGLVERALKCRQAGRDPDFLFPERAMLGRQHAACTAAIGVTA